MQDGRPAHAENLRAVVRFLLRCYRADNREQSLLNVFDRKVEYRCFLPEPDELLCGASPVVDVASLSLLGAGRKASLHRREKALLLASLFVVGRYRVGDDLRTLCGPLLLGPAKVQPGIVHPFVSADPANMRYNVPLLTRLSSLCPGTDEPIDAVLAKLPEPPLDEPRRQRLVRTLERLFPGLDAQGLLIDNPSPGTQAALRKARRAATTEHLSCISGSCVVLFQRSVNTRGVLSELRQMADDASLSTPVRRLLGDDSGATRTEPPPPSAAPTLPAILSGPQERVLEAARAKDLSVVIGPPGTGKSFTIATVALDAAARGQSVLIASKMDHAVDVVADKIEQQIGSARFVIRAGRKDYGRALKKYIKNLLAGIFPFPHLTKEERHLSSDRRHDLTAEAKALEKQLAQRSRDEIAWGRDVLGHDQTQNRLLRWWRGRQLERARIRLTSGETFASIMRRYQARLQRRIDIETTLLRDNILREIRWVLMSHRRDLVRFSKALRARSTARQERMFEGIDLQRLLGAFPVWQTNLADVSATVPATEGLFDLVIIDEASQCDMASCLPILQRGKRAMIVGDPHQLRHISFLARRRQQTFGEDLGMSEDDLTHYDYRDRSILDLAIDAIDDQESVIFLDEHFRSAPPIIQFSNDAFYQGRLRIMQDRPTAAHPATLSLRRINGSRDESGVNHAEVEAVVATVRALVDADRDRDPALCRSIGVISPFTAQVDAISQALLEAAFGEATTRHDMMVGSPFAFQGEERHVVILSLAVDANAHPASFRFLNRPDVFNVAITRARSQQIVIHSIGVEHAKVDGLLRRYLDHATASQSPAPQGDRTTDAFALAVKTGLEARNWTVLVAHPIAGFTIDLVATLDGQSIGIDLVGHPGSVRRGFRPRALPDLRAYGPTRRPSGVLGLAPRSLHGAGRDRERPSRPRTGAFGLPSEPGSCGTFVDPLDIPQASIRRPIQEVL